MLGDLIVPNSVDTMILKAHEATADLARKVTSNPDFVNGGASNVDQRMVRNQLRAKKDGGLNLTFDDVTIDWGKRRAGKGDASI